MIEPGIYQATIEGHAITETKKGDPQVVVTFTFQDAKGPQKITWYGYFTPKASPYTIENLITLGLKGNNPAGDIEIGKKVEIVIQHENDQEGKTRAKVRFINKLGEVRKAMPQDLARAKLSKLEGAVMAARQSNGPSFDQDEEINF